MTPSSVDLTILRWLVRRDHATASQIGAACGLIPVEVRTHIAWLETMRLVSSRQDADGRPPRRTYHVTTEGRRKVEISSAWAHGAQAHCCDEDGSLA